MLIGVNPGRKRKGKGILGLLDLTAEGGSLFATFTLPPQAPFFVRSVSLLAMFKEPQTWLFIKLKQEMACCLSLVIYPRRPVTNGHSGPAGPHPTVSEP
jgi:hypothetical protein